MSVVFETTIGDLTIDLFTDERPRSCMNFLKLCKMKYYNLNLLFSVQRNFITQTGDPTGTGRGGESIFEQLYGKQARYYEGEKIPIMKHVERGTVSMVSCGKHMFGSQFLITLGESLDSLDSEHLVFGQVVNASEVLDRLNSVLTDDSNRPYQDIRITHTVILHDPFPDPDGMMPEPQSPVPTKEMLESNYIGAEETIEENTDKTTEEMKEEIEAKEASARATILEIVGDIPDADVAPPENVLFVCKLNPVTTSEDLEIIFSRFGKIVSCEVITDRITNNSLQYAFIEFSSPKSCEDAYFKMDNVLIDDRRIHVDFSQSVSRIKYKGKGRIEYYDDDGKKMNSKDGSRVFNPNNQNSNKNNSNRRDRTFNNYHRNNQNHDYRKRNYENKDRNIGSRDRNFDNRDRNFDSRGRNYENKNNSYHDNDRRYKSDRRDNERRHNSETNRHNSSRNENSSKSEDIESLMTSKESRQKVLKQLKRELKRQSSEESSESSVEARKKHKKKKSKHYSSDSESDVPQKRSKHDSDYRSNKDKKKKKKSKKSKKSKKKKSYSSSDDSSD